jgi:hypothetical protein
VLISRGEPWDRQLVEESALLLVDSLKWIRDHNLLDTIALQCLPLDSTNFGDSTMFVPLFTTTKQGLLTDSLLPRFDTGYVPATRGRLARTRELRQLSGPAQLGAAFGGKDFSGKDKDEVHWLTGEISPDRTPGLRRYLMQEG